MVLADNIYKDDVFMNKQLYEIKENIYFRFEQKITCFFIIFGIRI